MQKAEPILDKKLDAKYIPTHLFFIQVEPDIDYIAPIVYELAKSSASNVMVICFNPLHNISNDHRLQYLINDLNVKVLYLFQLNKLVNLVCSPVFWIVRTFPHSIREKFNARITKSLIKQGWFKLYLQRLNPCSVTVDEGIPNHVKPVVSISKEINANVIVVPTGVYIMTYQDGMHMPKVVLDLNNLYFDYRIVPATARISEDLTENEKKMILKMSCPRYTEEWQHISAGLLDSVKNKYPLPNANGKMKVVIFGRPHIKFRKDHSLVKRIAGESNITFVFKDKPRYQNSGKYDNYPSTLLIRWADVVITSISSIILDILFYNKIFVYPKYLAPNDFGEFENYNFYWNVGSEDELLDVLKKINKNPDFNKLNTSDSDRFYNEMVYVGSKRNSLSDFNELYGAIAINNKEYVARNF